MRRAGSRFTIIEILATRDQINIAAWAMEGRISGSGVEAGDVCSSQHRGSSRQVDNRSTVAAQPVHLWSTLVAMIA